MIEVRVVDEAVVAVLECGLGVIDILSPTKVVGATNRMARQCLDQDLGRPRSRGSVSVNYTRMHAYAFAVRRRRRAPPTHHRRYILSRAARTSYSAPGQRFMIPAFQSC